MRSSTSFGEFTSVLCGVDFSVHSASALRYAAALSRANGGLLTVAYVVDPVLSAAAAVAYDSRAIARNARTDLRQFVRRTLGTSRAQRLRVVVAIGKPAPELLSMARRVGADVVVVGTHGLTGVKKAFFGSTTEAILRRSLVPVLAVPRHRRLVSGWPAGAVVEVTAMADNAAVEAAVASAARRRASMLVVTLLRSGAIGRFLEAVSAYRLVRHSPCPVLVVRPPSRRSGRRPRARPSRLRPVA
jgi:nucleotide-binding universal stress UspA family protein